jgi:ABC-2 type transport system ATP-binding protein
MEQVEEICDHIVLVNQGKKLLDGTVSDIKQTYKENIFSVTTSEPANAITSPAFEVVSQKEKQLLVKINEGKRSNDVLQYLINENQNIESFHEVLPSLNEIFIKLVEGTRATRQFQNVS